MLNILKFPIIQYKVIGLFMHCLFRLVFFNIAGLQLKLQNEVVELGTIGKYKGTNKLNPNIILSKVIVLVCTIWITIFISCFENNGVTNPISSNCKPISIKVNAAIPSGLESWRLKGHVKSLVFKTIVENDTTTDSVVFDNHGEILCRYSDFWPFSLHYTSKYNKNGSRILSIQNEVGTDDSTKDTTYYSYDSFGNLTNVTSSSKIRNYYYCSLPTGLYRLCTLSDNTLEDSSTFDLQGNILTKHTFKFNAKCADLRKYERNLPMSNYIADSNCEYHKEYGWEYAEHGNQIKEYWVDENYEISTTYLHFDANNNWTARVITNNKDSSYVCKQLQSITDF